MQSFFEKEAKKQTALPFLNLFTLFQQLLLGVELCTRYPLKLDL